MQPDQSNPGLQNPEISAVAEMLAQGPRAQARKHIEAVNNVFSYQLWISGLPETWRFLQISCTESFNVHLLQ